MFRDEYYYLACARRLAWGYVDHPPLSIALLGLWTAVAGDSLVAVRLLPALDGAGTVLVVGLTARALGGRPWAAAYAMLAAVVAPQFLGGDGTYSMNSFDVLAWTAAAYLLVRILHRGEERWWPALGVVLGLGLLNKISVLWLGAGLAAGLVLTGERRRLLGRGPWLAAAIALALFSPHLVWQAAHGWPTLEFIANATGEKMRAIDPLSYLGAQVLDQHPLNAPLWIGGLAAALFVGRFRRVRPLGVVYLAVLALLLAGGKSRAGYLAPAYPMLYAVGAVWIDGLVERRARLARWARWLRPAAIALLALGGLATLPLARPVLAVPDYVAYAAAFGIEPSTEENKEIGELPQFLADRFGWPELVDRVAAAYAGLSTAEREKAAIFTGNYGEAGAIEHLGRPRGLPQPVSGHNNYWLWGPGDRPGDPVIAVLPAGARPQLEAGCGALEDRGPIGCRHCMPYERDSHVWVCRNPARTLAELWPELKHFD
jgi:hypothetical protein